MVKQYPRHHLGALLITVIGLLGSNAQAASASGCTVLVVGDSLSAAYGLQRSEGWVSLLERRLSEKFPPCKLVNASISGETSAGGLSRLPALLKAHEPSHVVIELGANDGLRGLPVATLKSNLGHMITQSQASHAKVLLVGMQMPPNYGRAYTEQFSAVFKDVAQQTRTPLVPFMMEGFAGQRDAFQADGIHPNAGAQPAILSTIWPKLEKLLKAS